MILKNMNKEFSDYLLDNESYIDKHHSIIANKINSHWGKETFYPYIKQLTIVETTRDRIGFPFEVVREINKLREIHDEIFPETKPKNNYNLYHT